MSKTVESWVAVVQHSDEPADQETELVSIESEDGEPRVIDLSDGTRITLLEPAGRTA